MLTVTLICKVTTSIKDVFAYQGNQKRRTTTKLADSTDGLSDVKSGYCAFDIPPPRARAMCSG